MQGYAWVAYGAVGIVLAVVCYVLPAVGMWQARDFAMDSGELFDGRVTAITERRALPTGGGSVVLERLAVDVGGRSVIIERSYPEETGTALPLEVGDEVLVLASAGPNGDTYHVRERVRRTQMYTLAALFAGLVVVVGGVQGAVSLVALGTTLLVVWRYIVPAIQSGADPLTVCISGSLVVMAVTLVLGHGANRKTAVALVATAIALGFAGVFSAWAVDFAQLSGFTEGSASLQVLAGSLDARGLLLGGIIIGALGVLDDVTTTQSATVFELRAANPSLTAGELFRRAMNVGRDHIAATTNTLLLAYAGTSLPLLVILGSQSLAVATMVSFDTLATEIVRTLGGSMAIVAAVPITTALAAFIATRDTDTGNAVREFEGMQRTVSEARVGS